MMHIHVLPQVLADSEAVNMLDIVLAAFYDVWVPSATCLIS